MTDHRYGLVILVIALGSEDTERQQPRRCRHGMVDGQGAIDREAVLDGQSKGLPPPNPVKASDQKPWCAPWFLHQYGSPIEVGVIARCPGVSSYAYRDIGQAIRRSRTGHERQPFPWRICCQVICPGVTQGSDHERNDPAAWGHGSTLVSQVDFPRHFPGKIGLGMWVDGLLA